MGSGVGVAVGAGSGDRVGDRAVSVAITVSVGVSEAAPLGRLQPTANRSTSEAKPRNKKRFVAKINTLMACRRGL